MTKRRIGIRKKKRYISKAEKLERAHALIRSVRNKTTPNTPWKTRERLTKVMDGLIVLHSDIQYPQGQRRKRR